MYNSATGLLASQTYPSGLTLAYTYNSLGKIGGITANGQTLLNGLTYLPFSTQPKSWTWGNGQTYTRHYDSDLFVKDYPLGANAVTLAHNPGDLISSATYNTATTVNDRYYDYDPSDRLAFISNAALSPLQSIYNDGNGNRTQTAIGANTYLYSTDPANNQLDSVAGPVAKTYSYDSAGNPLNDGKTAFAWNAAGRLANVTTGTSTTLYRYNAFGERVAKWGAYVPSGPYRYVYDTAGHLIGEYDTNNTLRQETVYLGDIPVAVVKPGATAGSTVTYNIHADHLNSPRVILNAANTVVWRWDNTDPDGDGVTFDYNLRFPGQYYDKETGLHYNGQRYYDPQSGRYLTPDPIGLMGGDEPLWVCWGESG
ncbi:RHS repeat-associated core domain-containing protein [Methylovulum psychrotolerans]|uniref:RHS repeat-associated core domain-containing protein n=1 Tax=Methylovulum psychrotolerans TaxID=1704499 RepID=UPI0032ED6FC3